MIKEMDLFGLLVDEKQNCKLAKIVSIFIYVLNVVALYFLHYKIIIGDTTTLIAVAIFSLMASLMIHKIEDDKDKYLIEILIEHCKSEYADIDISNYSKEFNTFCQRIIFMNTKRLVDKSVKFMYLKYPSLYKIMSESFGVEWEKVVDSVYSKGKISKFATVEISKECNKYVIKKLK